MVRRQQAADRAIRPRLRSPGHPKFQRHVEVAFWGREPGRAVLVKGQQTQLKVFRMDSRTQPGVSTPG